MCGYIECKCAGCGYSFSPESKNRIVENRRKILGLTRKQMANYMGISHKTIRNYELIYPSGKYWNKTKLMMQKKGK
jgi:DNA-binding XRE family transcriptional regulator